nr:virion protein G11 [Equid gammaherpesvirus 5]UTK45555.1 virion protein G11 [Equid gammaherpesvirus 5]UTK45635.1 virion protein G11 [Equid gammaherpesvirus 5]
MAFSGHSLRRSLRLRRSSQPGIPKVTGGTATYRRRAGTLRESSLRNSKGSSGCELLLPPRQPSPSRAGDGGRLSAATLWSFSVFETYVKVTNKICLNPDMICEHKLPSFSTLKVILEDRYPGFHFTSTAYGGNLSEVVLLVSECPKNPVRAAPLVIRSSLDDIRVPLLSPLEGPVPAGGFTFYLLPVTQVKPQSLCLKIHKDRSPVSAPTTCSQDGAHLTSERPQIFFSGTPTPCEGRELPFLLAQRTALFERGGFCKMHTTPGLPCPVNAVKLSKHYVRVSVSGDELLLLREGGSSSRASSRRSSVRSCLRAPPPQPPATRVKVGMTLSRDALLAFRYNPYLFSPWRWLSGTVPVRYYGPPVIVPAGQAARVTYGNVYYAPLLPDLTAVIAPSCGGNWHVYDDDQEVEGNEESRFELMGCFEWPKGGTAEVVVKNRTCFLQVLRTGDKLGEAIFFIAPRIPLVNLIPARCRENLSVAVTVMGNVTLNASKLHKFSKLRQPLATSARD